MRIITHPRFSGSAVEGSDLVLLQLVDSLHPMLYTSVCLPAPGESFSMRQAMVTGFGRTEFGSNSNKLLTVQVVAYFFFCFGSMYPVHHLYLMIFSCP